MIGFRTVELSIIFSPVIVLYPIRNYSSVKPWYNALFKRSLMMAGPIFIKLGQWMSTRRDVYDEAFINTLSTLTTDSKAHPFHESKKQISRLIDLNEFKYIDPDPVGSGAIAQVHLGQLQNEEFVAIKVLHPNIHNQLDTDLKFLSWIGRVISLMPNLDTFDVGQELETFSNMMKDQVDLKIEHANLTKFSQNFINSEQIQFPVPIKSNQNVLLESFVFGVHLKEFMQLNTPFNDEIVRLGLKTVVKMILKDNFLHADLHPGNILVSFQKNDEMPPTSFYELFKGSEPLKRQDLLKSLKDEGYSPNLVVLDAGLVTKLSGKQYSSLVNVTNAALDSDSVKMANIFVSESKNPQTVLNQKSLELKLGKMLNNLSLEDSGTLLFSKLDASKIVTSFIDLVRDHKILLYGEYIGLLVSCLTVEGIGKSLVQNDFDLLPILSEAAFD